MCWCATSRSGCVEFWALQRWFGQGILIWGGFRSVPKCSRIKCEVPVEGSTIIWESKMLCPISRARFCVALVQRFDPSGTWVSEGFQGVDLEKNKRRKEKAGSRVYYLSSYWTKCCSSRPGSTDQTLRVNLLVSSIWIMVLDIAVYKLQLTVLVTIMSSSGMRVIVAFSTKVLISELTSAAWEVQLRLNSWN